MFFNGLKKYLLLVVLTIFICIPTFSRSNIDFGVCKTMIRSILVDSENNYWVATFGSGLWKATISSNGSRIFSKIQSSDGLFPHNMINLLVEFDNEILLATAGKGVQAYNPQKNTFRQFAPIGNFDRLHGLIRLSSGKLLLGSVGSGSAELVNGQWQGLGRSLPDFLTWVNSFYETEKNVFIATAGGLYYVPKRELGKIWDPLDTGLDFSVNSIMKLENKIYIATAMRGLYEMIEGKWPKRLRESKGGFYQLLAWKNQIITAGTDGLGVLSKNGKFNLLENYKFSNPKILTTNKENVLLIGTVSGEIIETEDLLNYRKICDLDDCISRERNK
jgi:hypothetical protein